MPDTYDDNGNLISSKEVYDDNGNTISQNSETGFKWVNNIIRPKLQQLAGKEEGVLNPDPNKNPLIMKSQLPETTQTPGMLGYIRHGIYDNLIRPMASPLGLLGMFEGSNPPTEPIGIPHGDIELPINEYKPIPKQLGPAPREIENPAKFIGGPSGGSGRVVAAEAAAKNPSLYDSVVGRQSVPTPPAVDLGEFQETKRLGGLSYGKPQQQPDVWGPDIGKTDKGYQLPRPSGDTTGGFQPQTNSEMGWPYDVIPNSLRPRAAQSEVLGSSGLKGMDLSSPTSSSDGIHFVEGGIENPLFKPVDEVGASDKANTGTGQPAELLHPNRREPISEILDDNGNSISTPPIKKPLDVVNASPVKINNPKDINKIPPGQADPAPMTNGKDISAFRAEFSSPQVVMDNFPKTKGVIQPIMQANDEKYKWLATTQREFADLSKNLPKADRQSLTMILNGEEVPNASPEVMSATNKARDLLDSVWDMADDSKPGIGFIDHYITHIKAQPDDFRSAVASIIDHQFGKESGLYKIFTSGEVSKPTGDLGDMYEKGLGNPESQFVKKRSDTLQNIETDYNRIIPVYLESMAKTIFDRPAVDSAKEMLDGIPEGKLKEFLQGYIKNYTRYDADAQLASDWNSLANQIATINARSIISFNPLVHMYHAGQLPANIWPELGTKYSTSGIMEFLNNPVRAYQELAKNGLFSNMIRPMQFQTPAQKFDSIGYFMNMVESIVKGTGYYGFKQKFLDAGMGEADATMKAISETKNATATVDPARYMRYFTPESNVLGGQVPRIAKQYHQIPMKLVEQFSRAVADFKNDPSKAARYIAGTSIAAAGTEAGLHTFHVNLPTLVQTTFGGAGQFGIVMSNVIRKLAKGDIGGALGDVATWAAPGGASIKKGLQLMNDQ